MEERKEKEMGEFFEEQIATVVAVGVAALIVGGAALWKRLWPRREALNIPDADINRVWSAEAD